MSGFDAAREALEAKHEAREATLRGCRALIQTCSKAIKLIHRRDLASAEERIAGARRQAAEIRAGAEASPEILHGGYIQDAEKEMVEAAALAAMIAGDPVPGMEELGVSAVSWLNGVGEAASELRRFLLDELREGRQDEAARLLDAMETTYEELTGFDFPDGVTGGLRRTCDALRAVIERTRSDLTMTVVQDRLIRELRRVEDRLGGD